MKNIPSFLAAASLVACASTGPVPMGQNLYSVSKTSAACGFRDAGGVRADLFQEMNEFCTAKKLFPELVTIEALDGVIGRRCASATIEFRCVTAAVSDPYTPSGRTPDRDANRNPAIATDRGQFGRKPDAPIVIREEVRTSQGDDIYTELKKLKELLDAKIITAEEFEARKKKILAK